MASGLLCPRGILAHNPAQTTAAWRSESSPPVLTADLGEAMAERILVVDDEPDILDLVELTLSSKDFEVETATNGREGLEKAQTGHPDLVLLDLSMPDMDGFEVMENLRSDSRTSDVPVIMLTARAQISDKLRGL